MSGLFFTGAGGLVQINTTAAAEPFAGFAAHRLHGKIELKLFPDNTADIQDIIQELKVDFISYKAERIIKEEQGVIDKWKAAGIRVIDFSDEDQAKMKAAADKASIDIIAKQDEALGTPGKSKFVWDQYQSLVKKWTAVLDAQGYPWD